MVVIRQSVLDAIYQHGRAFEGTEVCGVFVGDHLSEDGDMTLIEAVIQGEHTTSTNGSVTFTADTWNHIQQTMDALYPDSKIVGWYHTHPNHGVFLSKMDQFIHEQFFGQPWQVAFVYDPIRSEEGLFCWRDERLAMCRFVVEDDLAQYRKLQHEDKAVRVRKLHRGLTYSLAALLVMLVSALVLVISLPGIGER